VSGCISGLFHVKLRLGVISADEFGSELTRLFSSSYAEGFGIYALKHAHNDIAAGIRAFEHDGENGRWEENCRSVFNAPPAAVLARPLVRSRSTASFSPTPPRTTFSVHGSVYH